MKYKTKFEMLKAMEEKVNISLDVTISRLQNMKDSDLLIVTDEGSWSIAQNLEHLNYYASYYLPEI